MIVPDITLSIPSNVLFKCCGKIIIRSADSDFHLPYLTTITGKRGSREYFTLSTTIYAKLNRRQITITIQNEPIDIDFYFDDALYISRKNTRSVTIINNSNDDLSLVKVRDKFGVIAPSRLSLVDPEFEKELTMLDAFANTIPKERVKEGRDYNWILGGGIATYSTGNNVRMDRIFIQPPKGEGNTVSLIDNNYIYIEELEEFLDPFDRLIISANYIIGTPKIQSDKATLKLNYKLRPMIRRLGDEGYEKASKKVIKSFIIGLSRALDKI